MKRIITLACFILVIACKTAEIDTRNSYILEDEKSYIKVENEDYSFQYPKTYDYYMSHGHPNYYPKEIYPNGKYNVVWINSFFITEKPITDESKPIESEFQEWADKLGKNHNTYQYSINSTNTKFGETIVYEHYYLWGLNYVNQFTYCFDKNGIRYRFTYTSQSTYFEKYLPTFNRVFNTLKFKD